MASLRKKSTSSTNDSSSSSTSGSTSSSGSSSCSDSGSSTSDSESSSGEDVVATNQAKSTDSNQKSQVTTRRKSSELKAGQRIQEGDKSAAPVALTRKNSTNAVQKSAKQNEISSCEDTLPTKKATRLLSNSNTMPRKRLSSTTHTAPGTGGGKAPPAVVKQHHQQNFSAKAVSLKQSASKSDDSNVVKKDSFENSDRGVDADRKLEKKRQPVKTQTAAKAEKAKTPAVRTQPKRNLASRVHLLNKSSDESESESGSSTAEEDTLSSSDTEASECSTSSVPEKGKKLRNQKSSDLSLNNRNSIEKNQRGRKLTRSLSARRLKSFNARNRGIACNGTDTESDMDLDLGKYGFPKMPNKIMSSSTIESKMNLKKKSFMEQPRSQSPPYSTIEKKCPIEGCDSSGHLSGNHDRHFLPEACPIYHNMSASECKERANKRKRREEFRAKTETEVQRKSMTLEQKEYLSSIRESREHFRPASSLLGSEKIKLEKDCMDNDREPSLCGLTPDYDLQLFREAQAIASEKIEDELQDLPVGKGIKYITMGKYKMKVWYQSPYPEDAARLPKMYICEFCLRYQKSETGIKRHAQKCVWRHPPGDEIYRKGKLQVWQVDGKRHKQYCQHLCLLAKFFLDHKTLYYDVEPFLFYIMTLADVDGCHTVGYFSKEKNSFYNVSCILTLPPYQRKGYGRLLIDFSYLLTRVEGKIGSPEKPLSDLGLISYRSYWKDVLLDYLCNRSGNTLSIKDVSQEMAIYSYDIVSTLQALGMMKYWKGKHIVLKKQDVLDEYEERVKRRGNFPKIDESCLRWSPFVPPQTNPSP